MRDPIDMVAHKVSVAIKKANPQETKSVEVMSYALSLLINTGLTIFLILYIGAATAAFQETLMVLVIFGALRMLTKGGHFKSLTLCVIVTTALIAPIPHLYYPAYLILPTTLISSAVILIRSKTNLFRRILAVGLVILLSTLADQALTLVCLVYTFSLFPERR